MNPTKVKNTIKKFDEYLLIDRGLHLTTSEGYCRCMSIALRRMRKLNPQYVEIKEMLLWMHKQKYSYSYIRNTILAIEHFTRFKENPIQLGKPKKPKRIIKDTLTEAEISRMIVMSSGNIRQKAIVCILAYAGIRNSEICNLKVEDLDLGNNQLRVMQGKNKKDRVVNISAECSMILMEYLRTYARDKNDFLFTTLRTNQQIHTRDIRKTVKTIAKRCGIEKRVFPHLFRHSLATNLLGRGANLMLIKEQLGHAFIESTMVYAQSNPFRTKSEYDFYMPAYI